MPGAYMGSYIDSGFGMSYIMNSYMRLWLLCFKLPWLQRFEFHKDKPL